MAKWDESFRNRASEIAMKSKHVRTALIVGLCSPVIPLLSILGERDANEPVWVPILAGSFMVLLAFSLGYYSYRSAAYMVKNGVLVTASPRYAARLPGKLARLVLNYEYDGNQLEKITNVSPALAKQLDEDGSCEILVDPGKPTRVFLVCVL